MNESIVNSNNNSKSDTKTLCSPVEIELDNNNKFSFTC